MKIIKEIYESAPINSFLYNTYFEDFKMSVIDIETTGLSPQNSSVVLIGFATFDKNHIYFNQLFAEDLSEEKELILEASKMLSATDGFISFNGHSFDIPFLKKRASWHQVDFPILENYNLDLYRVVKSHSPLSSHLPNLKQKTLENYMGLWKYRKDEIHGGESVSLYFDYLLEKKDEYLKTILLHNKDDILNLHRLIKIVEQTDFHKALTNLGYPVLTENGIYVISKISLSKNSIEIEGHQPSKRGYSLSAINFPSSESPISYSFSNEQGKAGSFLITASKISYMGTPINDASPQELNILSSKLLIHSVERAMGSIYNKC